MMVIILLLGRGFIVLKHSVAADERSEAASGDAVVVNSGPAVFQATYVLRLFDGFAAVRSLVPSAAATELFVAP